MKQNFVRKLVLLLVVSFSIFTLIGCAASREQMIKEVENYTLPVENQNPKNAALVYVVRPNLAGTLMITCNKNGVPFDDKSPFVTSGIRLGSPALTTRGLKEDEFKRIGKLITQVVGNIDDD